MSQNYLEVNNWERNFECPKCVYELKQLAIRDTSGRVSLKLCASEWQELMMTMMLKAKKIQKYWENNVTISQRKSIQNSSSTSTCNKTSISKASITFVNWEAFHCLDAIIYSRWSVFKKRRKHFTEHFTFQGGLYSKVKGVFTDVIVNTDLRQLLKNLWTITTKFLTLWNWNY